MKIQSEGVKGSEGKIVEFGGWTKNLSMRGASLRFTLHHPSPMIINLIILNKTNRAVSIFVLS
jgi:hypothetical protein